MKRFGCVTLLVLVLGMAGCAGKWCKPGLNTQQFNADYSFCMAQAGQGALGNMFTQMDLCQQCMIGRGYSICH